MIRLSDFTCYSANFFLFRFGFSHAEDYHFGKWWNSLDFACNLPANSSENSKKRDTTGCRLRWLWTNWKFILEKCWIEDHTMLIAMPTDFSFPSGHTMVSFAAATVLWHWNRKVGIAAYLLAAVIAFSRLYLFVHFPSDVFAGAVIGILIGIAAIKGTDWMQKKFQKQKN